jgi:hypothetical protein
MWLEKILAQCEKRKKKTVYVLENKLNRTWARHIKGQ